MAQTPLFDAPHDRLGARLHGEVFGALPSCTARALDLPEVASVVRPLLDRGWRPAQLAARVGALPASAEPVSGVVAFLEQLAERDSPQQRWERERTERGQAVMEREGRPVACEASRLHWAAEARRTLGLPPRVRAAPVTRPLPLCAACGAEADFFVTRQVRLCAACVALLGSGRAQLTASARAAS